MVEQMTHNRLVTGSKPVRATIQFISVIALAGIAISSGAYITQLATEIIYVARA